jgi:hypothetical protein
MSMQQLGAGGFTVHGMRAAFRSWSADQGVAFEVDESALAHAPATPSCRLTSGPRCWSGAGR